jgi:nitrite reductase/ring-hydroxylating ferredoxin subunit
MNESPFYEVCFLADLPPGRARGATVDGRRIALYRNARGVFASDDSCPHRGGPLSEGDVMGDDIVCPWHLWSFNLETGENPAGPEFALVMHEVRIENDRILVKLTSDSSTNLP